MKIVLKQSAKPPGLPFRRGVKLWQIKQSFNHRNFPQKTQIFAEKQNQKLTAESTRGIAKNTKISSGILVPERKQPSVLKISGG